MPEVSFAPSPLSVSSTAANGAGVRSISAHFFAEGVSATAASAVSSRKVRVSCR